MEGSEGKLTVLREITSRVPQDRYARRWVNANGTMSGYEPAAEYEWREGADGKREKQRIGELFPLTDDVLKEHLLGHTCAGAYFVRTDNSIQCAGIDIDNKRTRKLAGSRAVRRMFGKLQRE